MADLTMESITQTEQDGSIIFEGSERNMAVAVAMLGAGLLAFTMRMTDVYFAEAIAWTFVSWGALLLYSNLLDRYQTFEVTDEALIVTNALRPWGAKKRFDWAHIYRMDLKIKRTEANYEDAEMQIYWVPEGEIAKEREDREYNPELARLIIERAGLSPEGDNPIEDLTKLPTGKAEYKWSS